MQGRPQEVHSARGLPHKPLCSSLHWWIARRLKANVNLVNTANTQKISLSPCAVCRQDNPGWSLLSQRMFYRLPIYCPGCPRRAVWLTAKCSPVTHLKTACLHVTSFRYMEQDRDYHWQGREEEGRLWAVWGWQYILVKLLVLLVWIRAFNVKPEKVVTYRPAGFPSFRWGVRIRDGWHSNQSSHSWWTRMWLVEIIPCD